MNYLKKTTEDSSITYYSKEYKEHYHSVFGAKTEALQKFIKPAKLEERAKSKSVRILDVPFGLGYNSLCTLEIDG